MLTFFCSSWILLFAIVTNTFAAPPTNILNQLHLKSWYSEDDEAYNRAFESLQSGKPNNRLDFDLMHHGGQQDITRFGGRASGGFPLIYNGPNQPSLAAGGAISGAVGSSYGQRYQVGPDFGLALGARYPIGRNGGSFNVGGGASFGSSYHQPQWGVGASLKIPFGRKK